MKKIASVRGFYVNSNMISKIDDGIGVESMEL